MQSKFTYIPLCRRVHIVTVMGIKPTFPTAPAAGVKFNSLRNIPSVEVVKLEKGKHNGGQMDILCKRF